MFCVRPEGPAVIVQVKQRVHRLWAFQIPLVWNVMSSNREVGDCYKIQSCLDRPLRGWKEPMAFR